MSEPLTPEQKVQHVKNNLTNTLHGLHNSLFNFVNGLPINEDQKKFALANLIQALHWARDGIEALQFEVTEPSKEDATNAAQEGIKQACDTAEHQEGNQGGEEAVTSSSDCLQQCEQEQKQEEVI